MIDQTFFLITYNDHTLYHAVPHNEYPVIIDDDYIKIPCHPIDKVAEFINSLESDGDIFLRIYMGHSKVLIKELLLEKKKPLIEIIGSDIIYIYLRGILS